MSVPTIPAGWRRLDRTEVIKRGDKFWDGNRWDMCHGSIGDAVEEAFNYEEEPVIRKSDPVPAADKEWLNPWD